MTRKIALIASTALALTAAPLLAQTAEEIEAADIKFNAANTLAGQENRVSTVSAIEGGHVVTSDGVLLGQIEDFEIVEGDIASIQIDVEAGLRYDGDTMLLKIGTDHVSVSDGSVAIEPTNDELFASIGLGGQNTAGEVDVELK